MDVTGERGDDDPPVASAKMPIQICPNAALRTRETWKTGMVRRQQQKDSCLPRSAIAANRRPTIR